MKTLYEEILENQEKVNAVKAEQEQKNREIAKRKQLRDLTLKISIGLIIAVVIVLIFQGIGSVSIKDGPKINNNSWENVGYGERPMDFYPNVQTVDYGSVYFQTGTWYKVLAINPDHSKKPYFFKSSHYTDNKFVFKDLGNGFYAVAAEKSDLIIISANQQ